MNIEEHFRRSLGTDYDLIIRNKLEQEHLALQKQRMMEEQQQQMILQKQQQQEAAAAAALLAVKQQQQQTQTHSLLKHHKKHQIHQHQAMLIAKHNNPSNLVTTPPSTPSPPIHVQQNSPISLTAPNIVTIPQQPQKQQVIINAQHDSEDMMSVDDHFAKALGEDTWKQFSSDRK